MSTDSDRVADGRVGGKAEGHPPSPSPTHNAAPRLPGPGPDRSFVDRWFANLSDVPALNLSRDEAIAERIRRDCALMTEADNLRRERDDLARRLAEIEASWKPSVERVRWPGRRGREVEAVMVPFRGLSLMRLERDGDELALGEQYIEDDGTFLAAPGRPDPFWSPDGGGEPGLRGLRDRAMAFVGTLKPETPAEARAAGRET